jgi:uncharacterized protein (TIGR03437 family)
MTALRVIMIRSLVYFSLAVILPISGACQVIQGPFNFRHLQFVTNDSGRIVDSRTFSGIMVVSQPGFVSLPVYNYYGAGTLSFSGTQVVAGRAPASFSASGAYSTSVLPTATTLTNPQDPTLSINARYGGFGVLGSSTESSHATVDLFVAMPAFNDFVQTQFSGAYFLTYIEIDGGVRSFFAEISADGAGNVTLLSAQSHAGSNPAETTRSGHGTYTVKSDGTGTISLPPIGSFPAATYAIQLSLDYRAIGGKQSGGQDFLVIDKATSFPNGALKSLGWSSGLGNQYSTAGLRIDASGATDPSAYVGTVNAYPGFGRLVESRRVHSSLDTHTYTCANAITINSDASAYSGANQIGLGSWTWISSEQSPVDLSGHEINVAFMTGQTVVGTELFLYPLAIVNAASYAPPILPVSPGELLTLYTWGPKAPTRGATASPPYPSSLLGFSVTANGRAVGITSINPGAVNIILPTDISGSVVTLQVQNGTTFSNGVELPLANTAPGVFTQTGNGLGDAAALHANYTPITADYPAHGDEVILLYVTGLGAVTPPIAEGALPGMDPPSRVTTPVAIRIGELPAEVQYAGLAPGFPGLYQLNVKVPGGILASPSAIVEIRTPDDTNRQATLPIR